MKILSPNTPSSTTAWLTIFGLAILWILLAVIVNPSGDFPLHDDWSYGRSVKVLLTEHRLHYDGWNSATLFLQILYGALFCLPFGFSFSALRISTLVAGFAGVIGTYILLWQVESKRFLPVLGSLVLMLNPIYFQKSFTFMTDVPFTALFTFAAIYFVRALNTRSQRDVAIGTLLSCCAVLIRQIAIPIPLAFGLTIILTSRFSLKTLLRASWPVIITIAVLFLYNMITEILGILAALQGAKQKEIAVRFAVEGIFWFSWSAIERIFWIFLYLGLFTLPFSLLVIPFSFRKRISSRRKLGVRGIGMILLSFFVVVGVYRSSYINFLGDTLNAGGLGPLIIRNANEWRLAANLQLPFFQTILFTLMITGSLILIWLVLTTVCSYSSEDRLKYCNLYRIVIFSGVACIIYISPLPFFMIFDRYLLPIIPLILLFLCVCTTLINSQVTKLTQNFFVSVAIALLAIYGIFAVMATHDYLAQNRARWEAVRYLIDEQGIAPAKIDGGFEVTGWYLYAQDEQLTQRWNNWYLNMLSKEGHSWFVQNPEYVLLLESHPTSTAGSTVVRQFLFNNWFPSRTSAVTVIKKSVQY